MPPATSLPEPYRSRAAPVGSTRYWSLLFAAPAERAALLGVYALLAEWRALTQTDGEALVAQTKLAWWREEMRRLVAGAGGGAGTSTSAGSTASARAGAGAGPGAGVHPISRFLSALPGAAQADFAPLAAAVEGFAQQATGVPLERASDIDAHAGALVAGPLLVAAALARADGAAADPASPLATAVNALSVADYLARALADYRREAGFGRIVFPVDSLLEFGIENQDLLAVTPPAPLRAFLERTRQEAAARYGAATTALVERPCAPHRAFRVLAALGARHLREGRPPRARTPRLGDLFRAWRAARDAH